MPHQTQIVEYRKLSDSEFAVLIRCCGECEQCKSPASGGKCTCHLHWHTMHASVINDPARLEGSLSWAHSSAAQNHAAAVRAQAALEEAIGAVISHPGSPA